MGLNIDSVGDLQTLIESNGIEIKNLEDLQDLLVIVNQMDASPEIRREIHAARERRQDREHAHAEKIRQMEYAERQRALELGFDPHTAEALAKSVKSIAETAGWIGAGVPLGLAGIAVGATAVIQERLRDSALFVAAIAIIWGSCALVSLLALVLSQVMIRTGAVARFRQLSKPGKPDTLRRDFSTAIKDASTNLDNGALSV